MIVNAMRQFKAGFGIGMHSNLSDGEEKQVRTFYNDVFLEKISSNY